MKRAPVASASEPAAPRVVDSASAPHDEQRVYTYQSAGIAERTGKVPAWLWLVAVLLVIWGIYYLIAYWNPPGTA
jgi:hypothetical protein